MLVNDSVTVAVEVPVFLTQEDIRYYRSGGFDLDFESDVITGQIHEKDVRRFLEHHTEIDLRKVDQLWFLDLVTNGFVGSP